MAYQQQYGYQQPPPKQGMNGCLKAFLIGGAALVALVVIVIVIAAVGVSKSSSDAEKSASKTCKGTTFAGKEKLDHCADANGEVRDFGQTATVKNLHRLNDNVFGNEICADVTIVNRSSEAKDFNVFDFKLQVPSGVVQSFELTGATLSSGEIVAGGSKSGSVCFKDNGESGQHIVIWKPEPFRSDRGIWLFTL